MLIRYLLKSSKLVFVHQTVFNIFEYQVIGLTMLLATIYFEEFLSLKNVCNKRSKTKISSILYLQLVQFFSVFLFPPQLPWLHLV